MLQTVEFASNHTQPPHSKRFILISCSTIVILYSRASAYYNNCVMYNLINMLCIGTSV